MSTPGVRSFEFSAADIGVGLLESITLGLYREASDVLREYISNEIDNEPPPTSVHVDIEKGSRTVKIEGDGPGMDFEGFRNAVKIGISFKDPRTNVGFRGIGIWAGVAACDNLVVATKCDADDSEYELRVNCSKLRAYFSSGPKRNVPLIDALNECAGYVRRKSRRTHGTEVTLAGISETYRDLLDDDKVKAYLTTVCPVAFEDGFKHASSVESFLKKSVPGYRRVRMFLGPDPIRGIHVPENVRPPIKGEIAVRLGGAKKPMVLGYFWLAPPPRARRIEEGFDSGIRIRVKNFTVVNSETVRSQLSRYVKRKSNLHFFDYWLGEIHVTHPDLRPNADRNDLEASVQKEALQVYLASDLFTNSMVPLTRGISELHNLKEDSDSALEEDSNPKRSDYPDLQSAYAGKSGVTSRISGLDRLKGQLEERLHNYRNLDGVQSVRDEWEDHVQGKVRRAVGHLRSAERRFDSLIEAMEKELAAGARPPDGEVDSVGRAEQSGPLDEQAPGVAEGTDAPEIVAQAAGDTRAASKVDAALLGIALEEAQRLTTFVSDPTTISRLFLHELLASGRLKDGDELRTLVQSLIRRNQREG